LTNEESSSTIAIAPNPFEKFSKNSHSSTNS